MFRQVRLFKWARGTGWLHAVIALAALLSMSGQSFADRKKPIDHVYHLEATGERIDVHIVLNKSESVKIAFPFAEALVSNPEVADVVPLTNQLINVLGKKIGVTRLSLIDGKKQVLGIVDIQVTHDLEAMREFLAKNPEFSHIHVTSVNGKILLTGTANNAVVMARVASLAEQFAPGEVTNAMSVASPQQVMLEVRFIEADRTQARGVGVTWSLAGKLGGTTNNGNLIAGTGNGANPNLPNGLGDVGNGTFYNNTVNNLAGGLASNLVPFGTLAGRVFSVGGVSADAAISALEQQGLARRLAEPNLVALSGDTASFLAGGEFPFPVLGENNTVGTQFKKFGIGLAFTPTVLAGRQINLKIEPEVSEIDATASVTIGNVQIPGLSVRRASTTVELRDGQSFAIAGLLQGSHISNKNGLPWIDDVPVMGALFRSASFQKNETDLVIIVTPRLVKPRIPGEKMATPLDTTAAANDPEFFLAGKLEVKRGGDANGHIIDFTPQPNPISGSAGIK
jgi:pilus assembly protein CpaC